MFGRHLFAVCDGGDVAKESIAFAFDLQRALTRGLSTAAADHGGAHYIPTAY